MSNPECSILHSHAVDNSDILLSASCPTCGVTDSSRKRPKTRVFSILMTFRTWWSSASRNAVGLSGSIRAPVPSPRHSSDPAMLHRLCLPKIPFSGFHQCSCYIAPKTCHNINSPGTRELLCTLDPLRHCLFRIRNSCFAAA